MDNYINVYATLSQLPEMYGNGLDPKWPSAIFVSGYLNSYTMEFTPTVARQNGAEIQIPSSFEGMVICKATYTSGWHSGDSEPTLIGKTVHALGGEYVNR